MTHHWKDLDREARIIAVVRLRDCGMSRSQIARELDVSLNSLHGFIFRQKISDVPANKARKGGWHDLTKDQKIAEVRRLTEEEGLPARGVAERLGLTTASVHRFMHQQRLSGLSIARVRVGPPPIPRNPDTRPIRPDAWTPLSAPVGFLANNECSWPVDGGYCGHLRRRDADGHPMGSYCPHHHAIAYPRPRPMSEETIEWLVGEDARAENRRQRASAPAARPMKREAVRYDDDE